MTGGGRRAPGGGGPRGRGGRAGVSAHFLTAGIWGVIERGGRPGARVGLHEQLNVIRPRPSRSSCVIDNPAAFLPGPGHQTGCRRRAGTRPFPARRCPCRPRRPRLRGQTEGPGLRPPGAAPRLPRQVRPEGRAPRARGAGSPRRQGAAAAGASRAGLPESGTKSLEPGKKEWKQRRRRGWERGGQGDRNK